jgi:hypothetical protein
MISLLALLIASGSPYATKIVPNVTPCVATAKMNKEQADREVRRLRRAGYLVEIHQKDKPVQIIDAPLTFPVSLSRGRVTTSGC